MVVKGDIWYKPLYNKAVPMTLEAAAKCAKVIWLCQLDRLDREKRVYLVNRRFKGIVFDESDFAEVKDYED